MFLNKEIEIAKPFWCPPFCQMQICDHNFFHIKALMSIAMLSHPYSSWVIPEAISPNHAWNFTAPPS